ncbi:TIGR03435 family protein [Terriglobus albidus]|uniref:TIGR03435 family protein n=1 Tax=Terriglobus albidus TaxID=1592106 RepID=A0A5B9EC10_9BACT|nr:TIGR03435 family protein [Terriglobus albidus]QEE29622.1 TIGR03435 family protein [Terriglobus albidus]
MKRLLAYTLLFCPVLVAQTKLATPASATATSPSKFEIADVHSSSTQRGFGQSFGGLVNNGFYINRDATMLNLIEQAYGVAEDTIAGGPGWVGADMFDVIAKVPAGTTKADADLMLRGLLAERFGLVVRNEDRPVPRYVMTIGSGSKLKPAANESATPGCKAQPQPPSPTPTDLASQPNIKVTCTNLTAAAIAENLHMMASGYLDHNVIDATKLEGSYDFDLEWTSRGALDAKGHDGISIFDAVSKQLGLKLTKQDIPQQSLAIISVNRKPTSNASGIATALALPPARFEVATIKLANPDAKPFNGILYQGGSTIHAGGTLSFLLALSLQITPNVAADTIIGLPKSATTRVWDIVGKMPTTGEGAVNTVNGQLRPPPLSVALEMMRGVLMDQFEMKTHVETREVPVYLLSAIGKSKLTKADESQRVGCRPNPNAPKPPGVVMMVECKNTSMGELAQLLQQQANAYLDHPVIDDTGLEGGWDFLVGWTSKAQLEAPLPPTANGEPSVGNGISVFDAVEKELGLKLVKGKRTIPVTVVDHVDETPVQ